MTDDAANLSIDFLIGFTIFIIAFIWVASMIPGILIGLQSNTIDYDAVAYRTGVILVEDPGWPASPPWEFYGDLQKNEITRFGLAISKDSPGILSEDKVNRFFCSTFVYPDDYHSRAIFGDYPYHFNISVFDGENNKIQSVGDVLPEGHGYIRRLVKIKGGSNATIGTTQVARHQFNNTENVTRHEFSILINNAKLQEEIRNPAYNIDPSREQIEIKISDLRSTIMEFPTAIPPITRDTSQITLTGITMYKLEGGTLSTVRSFDTPLIDGSSTPTQPGPACFVDDNVTLIINPRAFDIMQAGYSEVYINLSFAVNPPSTFLNNTNNGNAQPFEYNYNPANVTQPQLRDAVAEVAVW